MSTDSLSSDFESFPQRELIFQLSRRELFGFLHIEYQVNQDEAKGIPGYRLADLGNAPDEYLAQIVPVILPDCVITVADGWVWGHPSSLPEPTRLFPLHEPITTAFNLINGLHDLGTISLQMATQTNWSNEQAFSFVRGLFLHLVQRRVCAPR